MVEATEDERILVTTYGCMENTHIFMHMKESWVIDKPALRILLWI